MFLTVLCVSCRRFLKMSFQLFCQFKEDYDKYKNISGQEDRIISSLIDRCRENPLFLDNYLIRFWKLFTKLGSDFIKKTYYRLFEEVDPYLFVKVFLENSNQEDNEYSFINDLEPEDRICVYLLMVKKINNLLLDLKLTENSTVNKMKLICLEEHKFKKLENSASVSSKFYSKYPSNLKNEEEILVTHNKRSFYYSEKYFYFYKERKNLNLNFISPISSVETTNCKKFSLSLYNYVDVSIMVQIVKENILDKFPNIGKRIIDISKWNFNGLTFLIFLKEINSMKNECINETFFAICKKFFVRTKKNFIHVFLKKEIEEIFHECNNIWHELIDTNKSDDIAKDFFVNCFDKFLSVSKEQFPYFEKMIKEHMETYPYFNLVKKNKNSEYCKFYIYNITDRYLNLKNVEENENILEIREHVLS